MTYSLVFLGHSTVLLDLGGVRVLTDPVLRGRLLFLRRVVAPVRPEDFADVDVVVLSHLHHDHCDLASLALLGRDVPLVAPEGAAGFLERHGFRRVVALPVGRSHTVGGVAITATPAVHDGRRRPFGPEAAAVGYRIATARAVAYFAGDTDLFPAMSDLRHGLDLALIPVWGWGPNLGPGHLDPERAAEAVARLRPRRAVPIHWGTLYPYGLKTVHPRPLRTPARAFAESVAARGLPTEVTLLAPGGGMAWPS